MRRTKKNPGPKRTCPKEIFLCECLDFLQRRSRSPVWQPVNEGWFGTARLVSLFPWLHTLLYRHF
jgi:hypothetical protein